MKHLDTSLSLRYNLSLGLIPGLIAILSTLFLPHEQAIYVGSLVGIIASVLAYLFLRKEPKQVLLYCVTGMLMLMSLIHAISICGCPNNWHVLVIEFASILPALLIVFIQRGLRTHHPVKAEKKHRYRITIETLMASAKIICVVAFAQFVISIACWILFGKNNNTSNKVIFCILPCTMLISAIILNQLGLCYFNRMMRHVVMLPIVNVRGDVIGKCLSGDSRKKHIHPMIRISVVCGGMELLRQRSGKQLIDEGKWDLLIEGHLFFKESLEQGAYRMLRAAHPELPNDELKFVSRYYMEYEGHKRLVYLFALELDEEYILSHPTSNRYKPWTWKQIEENVGKNVFSHYFEYEIEAHRKLITAWMERRKRWQLIENFDDFVGYSE